MGDTFPHPTEPASDGTGLTRTGRGDRPATRVGVTDVAASPVAAIGPSRSVRSAIVLLLVVTLAAAGVAGVALAASSSTKPDGTAGVSTAPAPPGASLTGTAGMTDTAGSGMEDAAGMDDTAGMQAPSDTGAACSDVSGATTMGDGMIMAPLPPRPPTPAE
ncbi:MAG: hypothetical protein HYX32_10760 [Actinobacteria bacterium]|nr:hypothetical protein [Actinomycetota bacterium]